MSDEMDEIIADFISEAGESLEKIEHLFVELEKSGYNKDLLHEIFRGMHTIKGAAGFLGFRPIVDVTHRSENILKRLRDGDVVVSAHLVDVVLKSVDMVKLLMQHVSLKDGREEDISGLLRELDETLDLKQPLTEPCAAPQAAGSVSGTSVDESRPICDVRNAEASSEAAEINLASDRDSHEKRQPDASCKPLETLAPKEANQTLRIDVGRVDKVMDLTGEIVLVRNRLLNISNYLEKKFSGDGYVDELLGTISFLDLVTSDMQLAVMKMRMQPLKKVFGKFPRLVRDLSNSIGKEVELVLSGEETEVDRSVIEHIGDPMVHIIRNAIDHGLETRDERLRAGKQAKGRLAIRAYQQGNQIIIEVSDDGNGIDVERVKKKAAEKGLVTDDEAQRMTDETAINLIFRPGFSTMELATELSGRGVGMDVVKTNISKLNGYVEVMSKRGLGSTFRICIPLTLAIIEALMVRAGGSQFAVPLAPVEETIKISESGLDNVTGQPVLIVRDKVCPVFELSGLLNLDCNCAAEQRYVLVIAIGDRKFCVAVDELLGQEEVVIKAIHGIETDSSYVLGATITGEGKVVLILDLAGISRAVTGTQKG